MKKISKKILSVGLSALFIFSLASCGNVAEQAEEDVSEVVGGVEEKISEGEEKIDEFAEDEVSKAIDKSAEKAEKIEGTEKEAEKTATQSECLCEVINLLFSTSPLHHRSTVSALCSLLCSVSAQT